MPLMLRRTLVAAVVALAWPCATPAQIDREKAIARHLRDGKEFQTDITTSLKNGEALFAAPWTNREGAGRPQTKGTGAPLSDPASPLLFPRNFNRISVPDANSYAGCHAIPRVGGGGDLVANAFVLGQRFDFATFDHPWDARRTNGTSDEMGCPASLQSI